VVRDGDGDEYRKPTRWKLYDFEGEVIGQAGWTFDPDSLCSLYVAAAATHIVACCWPIHEDGKAIEEVDVQMQYVVAWKLDEGDLIAPVLMDSTGGDCVVAFQTPDGKWDIPEDRRFDSMEDLKAYVLASANAEIRRTAVKSV
jgi:hypothetical protein